MTRKKVMGEVITETIPTNNTFSGVATVTSQEDYAISHVDFYHLKNTSSPISQWTTNTFFAFVGYGVSLSPKMVNSFLGKTEVVSQSEWIALIGGVVVSVILFAISKCLPNERKTLLKNMEDHFKQAPKTRRAVRK